MNIGIYIYDDAEVLDFSGPFEVFSTAKRLANNDWQVCLIAENNTPVMARGGFSVNPHYSFVDHPAIDLLIVVGGVHTVELEKPAVINWIRETAGATAKVASVCTGAFLLAKAGLLDGLTVTTHWEDLADLANMFPRLNVISNKRWVSQDKFTTSAGISAGIDMSLQLVAELGSPELAELTAKQMQYQWHKKI
ncbi:MAG: transcriptional regulator GlxA family with amidase domain [Pseudoalteromonas rhizosphaerae]|jgi:transcriptional regulator GlxA family with amidase domain|uniref:DJ-1/PfpI family protein n=1 Tax=Pseudoalteromonas neustonica TaxID=1840331 RepID=A0ABY3FCD6_9GAMM|nr:MULTISPECIES: DJ-1/PfpI family protein [Pseudoalteromonas]MBB1292238.1 DJ-1/PfpI family protein [Pseudoalteromonas sp. SR41-4]MBB1300899.1 DJ-1/PfpI family protein [Pseudoalteromonas sp. SR44-8]MBB1310830.1 DJ-1/PfpI family protein [Pseudoalteromonas sp. SR41-8]MBB1398253.1 DJ-1/PfpI family protein [Pseudoalteromonas sp. SG44-8]MBB1408836.1 DJ-1/PfpI family protein [Pseudoalteromonas sp. SG44-17]|tara:strand:- start:8987 stop:9565 length:579 start_codon:yes stop_codon:yes gene_type:complete